jgi:endo-1,3-1,4-beta-glycanase ExoK
MSRPAGRSGIAATALMAFTTLMLAMPAEAARRNVKPPAAMGTFVDGLQSFDGARWTIADGWTNGSPFDNAWGADHVSFHDGVLDLRLDDAARLGAPYTSGEYRTNGYYGYGCFEAGFRAVAVPGVVTSFFTFAGPYDNGGNGRHNEIDFEILGNDSRSVQLNYWTNDDTYASRNEQLIPLSFDAAAESHAYAFKWTAGGIRWYIDGQLVHEALDSPGNPTPQATESLQKIMVNLWPVDESAAAWAGTFQYPGVPLHALYDWIRYTAGEDCDIAGPPNEPPPPSGDPADMHVQAIEMSLAARDTQAIARVTVVDGLGQPVPGATVLGAWSGVITGGDGSRSTDATGLATFYSARSRTPGLVQFCVTGITASGKSYDSTADLESCDSITK